MKTLLWISSFAPLSTTMFTQKRISLGCFTYDTEETTDSYFQFALREKHDAKCGGDPETSPVVKRYRVHRRSGKIEQWEAASDTWHAYKGAQTK